MNDRSSCIVSSGRAGKPFFATRFSSAMRTPVSSPTRTSSEIERCARSVAAPTFSFVYSGSSGDVGLPDGCTMIVRPQTSA